MVALSSWTGLGRFGSAAGRAKKTTEPGVVRPAARSETAAATVRPSGVNATATTSAPTCQDWTWFGWG